MKFGIHFLLSTAALQSPERRIRDTIEQAVLAESMGFESVWPVEQHFAREVSVSPCPAILLAAIAERTRTLRLGTAIVQLALHHPLRVAEEIGVLDVLSGGRVELGVGRGSNPGRGGWGGGEWRGDNGTLGGGYRGSAGYGSRGYDVDDYGYGSRGGMMGGGYGGGR